MRSVTPLLSRPFCDPLVCVGGGGGGRARCEEEEKGRGERVLFKVWGMVCCVVPCAMDVQEGLQAVLLAETEDAVELVQRAVHAAHVRLVRDVHPVPDGDADGVDPCLRQGDDFLLRHPRPPVPPQLLVRFLVPQRRAKRQGIDAHVLRRVVAPPLVRTQELVEQARCDPRFQHQPPPQRRPPEVKLVPCRRVGAVLGRARVVPCTQVLA
jgi:hypothetical protein